MSKHAGGRPKNSIKLTPEIQRRIVDAIRGGNYIETAAACAGVSKDTLYRWLRDGARAKTGVCRSFSDAVEKALAEAETRDVALIGEAAKECWQAAAWRLERRFPQRWAQADRMIRSLLKKDVDELYGLAYSGAGGTPPATGLRADSLEPETAGDRAAAAEE